MTEAELFEGIQCRVAKVAIGASTVRGQGDSGIATIVREFLSEVPLWKFGTKSKVQFKRSLDKTTMELKEELSRKSRSWGLARKCINIFLRDAFYNTYLRSEFGLSESEPFYEIPLDRIVVTALLKLPGGTLPKWNGVKYLNQGDSNIYQEFADIEARQRGISRVHLDTFLWR